MTASTVHLEGAELSVSELGGKGHALNRLISTGVRVPPTGVITSAAYHRFVETSRLDAFLSDLVSSPADRNAEKATAAVDAAFLEAPMTATLEREILDLAHVIRGHGMLAIRSSATAEDLESASFAGQYRSLLEIESDEDVLRAVRLVWASLWLPAPRAYRAHAGISDDASLAMAVVVMRLVDARRAGVVFTVNPSGDGSDLRVEAVDGLAEALVSGEVTPDAWELSRITERRPAVDPTIDGAVAAALSIEHAFGTPQDVEWAADDDHMWIVQARPITTLVPTPEADGFDTAIDPSATLTTAGIAEMLPGVLPPLIWSSVRPLLEEGFRRLFDGLSALPAEAEDAYFLRRIQGRAVLDLDLLKAAAHEVPGGSAAEIERQYFGRTVSDDVEAEDAANDTKGLFKGLRTMLAGAREINARRAYLSESEIVVAAIDEIAHRPPDCHIMSNHELLAYRNRVLDLAGRAFVAEVAVAASAANAYRGIELFLEPHLGDEAVAAAQHLTAGGIDPCGAQLALKTCDIAHEALEVGGMSHDLDDVESGKALRRLVMQSKRGKHLRGVVADELAHAGSSSVFAGPTWGEDDDLAWNLVVQAIQTELKGRRAMVTPQERLERLEEIEGRFATGWKYRMQRIMTGQVVDMRKRMLRRLVFDAVEFLNMRERTKSAVLLLGGELRRIHMALGHRLHQVDALPDPIDVDLLSATELEDAVDGTEVSRWELDRRRRTITALRERDGLPQLFTGHPDQAKALGDSDADSYRGWAASSGTYEGVAQVVKSASQALEPGAILVARTTDPAWTPLFLTAGAIVVEQGGPLSHAAIIARELKLPAVLNVPGLVERLAGAGEVRLRVDGDGGTVTILDATDEAEPTRVAEVA